MKKHFLLLLLGFATATHLCSAEDSSVHSLEWLADYCADSGLYQVTALTPKRTSDTTVEFTCELKLVKTFRGNPPKTTSQEYYRVGSRLKEEVVKSNDVFLLCWKGHKNDPRPLQLIDTSRPQIGGSRFAAVASNPIRILTTPKTILDVFEERLRANPQSATAATNGSDKIELHPSTDDEARVFSAAYGGSMVYLFVPPNMQKTK